MPTGWVNRLQATVHAPVRVLRPAELPQGIRCHTFELRASPPICKAVVQ
jgi:hypothetical protein